MFKNYIKIAWRNLLKNKIFSLINILGLATGLSCFLLISLYVLDELSFDRFFKNSDRIYRINASIRFGGSDFNYPLTSDMMGQTLKKDYPQEEEYARIYNSNGNKLIKKGNDFINERNVCHADSTFFRIFDLPAISGDLNTALNEPNTVVITEKVAIKYFGSTTAALGKSLETNDDKNNLYKITAVLKDIPDNAHFNFDFYFSMKNAGYNWGQYMSHNFHTYLLLKQGTDYRNFEKKFNEYINKYCIPALKQIMQINSIEDFNKTGNKLEYNLTPLTKIHLYSGMLYEFRQGGNIQYIYIFSIVALFILLIACINFMNLTTAKSISRAKEVGIRKVLGTEKKDLIAQFLVECIVMVVLSLILAIGIAYLILPAFNSLADKTMTMKSLYSPMVLPLLVSLPIIVGMLAGIYPAFFMSSFKPIEVLKGKLKQNNKSFSLRSMLVIFQFTTSIILIIGTIVIYRQLHFIQNRNVGFNKDQVLIINDTYALNNNLTSYKNEMLQTTGIKSATISGFLPVPSNRSDNVFSTSSVMDTKNGFDMQTWNIDCDYIKTLGMELVKGRSFLPGYISDSNTVIINETTAKTIGMKDPLGKKLYSTYYSNNNQLIPYTIIGVVKNFNYESLKQTVAPLGFFLKKSTGSVSFKINAAHAKDIVKQAELKWKTMTPGIPFSYRFMDDAFNDMYNTEQKIGKIILIFSVLAILIACLGLFGLSIFIAEQRKKEIGIRKVLGSSIMGVVQLLSLDFLKLVIFSFVLACPFAWYFMHQWLENFAYRVDISWWIFLLAAFLAVFIALATVSYQALKAALANPVRSLRTE